jgi:hypothetical protein
MLLDMEVPENRNVTQKEREKYIKCKRLCIEIQRMWNMKCVVILVVMGATGRVTRGLKKNLETIPGKYSIDSKQYILGTSHTKRTVLHTET